MQEVTNSLGLQPRRRQVLTRFLSVALLVTSTVLLMLACGGGTPSGNSGSDGKDPPQVTGEAPGQQPDTLNELQSHAREVLAARLAVPAESLTLVKDEEVQWADASLGCPQEGRMYAQVITPGHRMTFQHDEDTYEVHTAAAGSSVEPVSCEGGVSY